MVKLFGFNCCKNQIALYVENVIAIKFVDRKREFREQFKITLRRTVNVQNLNIESYCIQAKQLFQAGIRNLIKCFYVITLNT